jgi:hypothetical protein
MSKRHRDAIAIQQGACNPSGIARSLVQAIDEARAENGATDSVRADPACRLICHQLAFIMGVGEIDYGDDTMLYNRLMDACEQAVAADNAATPKAA